MNELLDAGDDLALAALADHEEDRGEPLRAQALRAALKHGWRPGRYKADWWWTMGSLRTHSSVANNPQMFTKSEFIPDDLFAQLTGGKRLDSAVVSSYPSRAWAYTDLIEAFARLSPERREELSR